MKNEKNETYSPFLKVGKRNKYDGKMFTKSTNMFFNSTVTFFWLK